MGDGMAAIDERRHPTLGHAAGQSGLRLESLPRGRRRARSSPRPPIWLVLLGAAVSLFALLPLLYLLVRASNDAAGAGQTLWRPKTLQVLANTVVLVGSVALSAVMLAVPLAWLTTHTDLAGRRFWTTAFTLPLVIPSFVGALAYVAALGPRGLAQQILALLGITQMPSIYGFWGAWLILTLFTLPYAFLTLRAACLGLDASQEDAARSLGLNAWQTFRRVTLPRLRPAMATGALLAALYTLGDFGVVTLLRYDTFTRAIYTSYRASFDRSAAAGLALALALLTGVILLVEARARGQAPLFQVTGVRRRPSGVRLGRWQAPALLLSAGVAIASLGVPLAVLIFWCVRSLLTREPSPHLLAATQTSVILGTGVALLAGLSAAPIAVLSVRYPSWLTRFVERSAYLGYALPGIVIAIAYVAITVRTPWYQTLGMLVLACASRFLAQAIGATRLSLLQVNPRLEEAARGLGASLPGALWRVTVPLIRPGLLAGVLLVFLTTMKELPITLLLIPAGERTLPTLIWTAASDARYGEAALPALLLVAITAVPTFVLAQRQQALTA